MVWTYFKESLKRGCVQIVRRPVYLTMVIMGLLSCWFLMSLMRNGGVTRTPVGIVDLDHSVISRNLTRNLNAFQMVEVKYHFRDYHEAIDAVQRGEVYGFFYIPADLSQRALAGRQPCISYYINYAYFPSGSMQFKGFKTISVLANGKIVKTALTTVGMSQFEVTSKLQPISTHIHMIGNPWLNYNYYLNPSFVPTLFSLIVMLLVVFSICSELKNGTSRQWLKDSGDSMGVALMGKILPQTFIMIAAGWLLQYMMYCVYHFPLNCNPWHMLIAMALLVIANQAFAVMACCIVPNFRYASIMCTLLGIITFSFGGFSLPQETMYNWVTALGFIMPVKYYFLIYVDQALNGIELYYSRIYYAALILYILIPVFLKWRLKKECYNPVYVP